MLEPMSAPPARKSLHVLLPTLGSAGDVHPFIALGLALRARGHRATLITNPFFEALITDLGLEFLPVGTIADAESAMADPDLWHPRRGFNVVARRVIIPAIPAVYRLIERHASAATVVAASSISFGARLAQERLGVPTASVHLQPAVIRSLIDQGMAGNVRISPSQPMWFKRAFFRLADWAAIDRRLAPPLNDFRATLGLAPVRRVLRQWIHSPDCVIAFFPPWFAAPQPDWPPHVHLVGFPLWDGGFAIAPVPAEVTRFLDAGEPPVLVTPGSAASTMGRYFSESVAAVRRVGMRAMLVTNFPQQLPRELPAGVDAFGYVPFSAVLPRVALIVYHGGIGTLAQAIAAATPHLVVPSGHDQFDNAWRIERLGLGRCIPQAQFRAARAVAMIDAIRADTGMRQRAAAQAGLMDPTGAVARACELVEALARTSRTHGGYLAEQPPSP
jgi:UDP:flavonoid glycosyltransferase YjiC (YdhE family)